MEYVGSYLFIVILSQFLRTRKMARTRPPLVSIVSPDDVKKLRKMHLVNFGATLIQLSCSLAIVLVVRYALGGYWRSPTCLAATPAYPWTCEYAYAVAFVSMFFGFWLSFTQCLTMDCCGAGRLFEALFDVVAFVWWLAGAITLTIRGTDATAAGVPQEAARSAVFALCWVSCELFLILMCTNFALMKRMGKAYTAAVQELQQYNTPNPAPHSPYGTYPPPMWIGDVAAAPAGAGVHTHTNWGPMPPPGRYPAPHHPSANGSVPACLPPAAAAAVPYQRQDTPWPAFGAPTPPQSAARPQAAAGINGV